MKKRYDFLSFPVIVVSLLAIFIFLFVYQFAIQGSFKSEFRQRLEAADISCLPQGHQSLQQHFHPRLTILIDDEHVSIPADMGISGNCMSEIHTHDESGQLHVESANARKTFTLGQFFAIWGMPFSESEILEYKANNDYEIIMTVDGVENTEFENLILADEQNILISYQKRESQGITVESITVVEDNSNEEVED